MKLKELLFSDINIELDSDLNIKKSYLKKIFRSWPVEILEIILLLQKNKKMKHYVFQLPNGDGALEFNLKRRNKVLCLTFHDKNNLNFQRRFKRLLAEVYRDIQYENQIIENDLAN